MKKDTKTDITKKLCPSEAQAFWKSLRSLVYLKLMLMLLTSAIQLQMLEHIILNGVKLGVHDHIVLNQIATVRGRPL